MCISCNEKKTLTVNQILKIDPTKTLSTRKRFVAQMVKRFALLKKAVREHIIGGALLKRDGMFILTANTTAAEWRSFYDPDKIDDFMDWLENQNNRFILSKGKSGIEIILPLDDLFEKNWTDAHIRSAYQKGISRAQQELQKAGANVSAFESQGGLSGAFNNPFHVDRVRLAFTQTYRGLKGITKAMDSSISSIMAQGMAEGRNPRVIAKDITGRIDKIGLTRAKTLARTEVIRAHHNANINEYERVGIVGVKVKAEWTTAGFNVCPICSANEGSVYTLDQIRGLIPAHPNCRCIALPIVPANKGLFRKKTKRSAFKIVKGVVKFKKV